ncbi:A/g-specific adenine glycosylase, partial [Globisporangium splendens]
MEDFIAPPRRPSKRIQSESKETVVGSSTPISSTSRHRENAHDFDMKELRDARTNLLKWYDAHRRKLPWRGDPPPYLTTATHTKQKAAAMKNRLAAMDAFVILKPEPDAPSEQADARIPIEVAAPRTVSPYETWVSEIMLQQTRVDTVVEYFLRWTEKFPTVEALANGSEEDVNALWAGLGYYRRARMLHAGAKYVVENFGGELPSTIEQLLTIPGIGPYTAGAISSIAFGNREPLVDGNVIRVLARLRAIGADPKNKQLIKFSWKAAGELVEECDRPGALNQALMELGATMCTVQNPECSRCPVRSSCLAYEESQSSRKEEKTTRFASESLASESDACTICDASRYDEWNESITEVTKYPLKAKKGDSKNEVICVAVISYEDEAAPEAAEAKKRKGAAKKPTKGDDTVPDNWHFLMARRPEEGLLAGQWEFIHQKVDTSDKIPAFAQRKKLMQPRLSELLGEQATKTKQFQQQRRDLGELTHIFSHVKHHMGIEHLHFNSKPAVAAINAMDADGSQKQQIRWMNAADMKQLGITTGVKKILNMITKAPLGASVAVSTANSSTKHSAASNLGAAASTAKASHVADGASASTKRFKTLTSFFKK